MESDIRFSIMGVGRSNNLQGTLSIKKGNCMGNEEALTGESDVANQRNVMRHRNYLCLAIELRIIHIPLIYMIKTTLIP
jgi:hypothetical protein